MANDPSAPADPSGFDVALVLPDVPDELATEIGHIMVRWARLEWQLTLCLYQLFGLNEVQGRITFRTSRLKDMLDIIDGFVAARNLKPKTDLMKLKQDISRAYERRSWLCHSTWVRLTSEDRYMLRVTTGDWQPAYLFRGKVSRRKEPEHIVISRRWCATLCTLIIDVTSRLETLRAELRR